MNTLSNIAAMLIPVELPCGDCDATGRQTAIKKNVIDIDSWDHVRQPCSACFGRGQRQAEVCPLCGREENGCNRLCKRTTCCQKHPVQCSCPNGIELYRQAYGLPRVERDALVSEFAL